MGSRKGKGKAAGAAPGDGAARVVWAGPGIRTWHPVLGMLTAGREFDLPAADARAYVECGLLAYAPAQIIDESEERTDGDENR